MCQKQPARWLNVWRAVSNGDDDDDSDDRDADRQTPGVNLLEHQFVARRTGRKL